MKTLLLDVTDVTSLISNITYASTLFEENRIDILVNSAGTIVKNTFFDISENEYDRVMDTNAKGTFFMSREVGRFMIDRGIKGHILNISSASALRPAWTPYEMSKWAIRGLTMGLADSLLPYGIIVNAIGPGPVATPMLNITEKNDNLYNCRTVSKRYAMPCEIASLAVFMVSDLGNLVVGDTYYMTGGSGIISMHR